MLAALLVPLLLPAQDFEVQETTIAEVHAAMQSRRLTCRALVDLYLKRIEAFDKSGPAINSIILVNPDAAKHAADLDARFAQGGLTGPLHCVPVIVKDNFETKGLRTSNGALVFANYIPTEDAFQVRRIKEAGAIVLAKSNLAEWAFTPYETVSSILPGYTKNPYALDRVTAGSSGGTAAAIAASLGLVGLGSDTGNSIRGPSAHQALAGIRSTMGLTSRAGVFPLSMRADIAGPMTRTVEDAARVLQVIAGPDPRDPVTAAAASHPAPDYVAALDRNALKGAVIGILRQAYERSTTDPEVAKVFLAAVEDLRRAGATIVETATVEGLDALQRPQEPCMGFKYDMNQFLAARGAGVPVKTLADIVKSNGFHPTAQRRLEMAEKGPENGPGSAACEADERYREGVRAAVLSTMEKLKLDAFVYPTWSNPPRLIGDLNTPHGDNSQFFSPTTGFPAITVPMGYTRGGALPAGMTIFGRPWTESTLIRYAYAYEQATRRRRPPSSTPALSVHRESIEWTDAWMPNMNDKALPRVLLIGDSITRGYYAAVEEKLKGKAYVARYTTSKAIGDPALLAEIATFAQQAKFEAVHFNIGMHGWAYSEAEYQRHFPALIAAIREAAPGAKLIWASTTPVRKDRNPGPDNQRIAERNRIAREAAAGLVQDDLHALMSAHGDMHSDDVHFTKEGSALMADQVAATIEKALPRAR
jgi:Asp-tRNA(Asn)/Glu-tRNA(Gln) amidotransferase A subunit family amidase/lysophospholipase L1-like esterase